MAVAAVEAAVEAVVEAVVGAVVGAQLLAAAVPHWMGMGEQRTRLAFTSDGWQQGCAGSSP